MVACVGAIVGPLPLSGVMFPCFHIWMVLCLLTSVLSPVIDDGAAWHTATRWYAVTGVSQRCFGRFCPLCYSFTWRNASAASWTAVEMLHPPRPGGRWSEIPGPCSPHKSWPGLNINQSWGKLTNHFNICQNTSTFCAEDFSFLVNITECRIC